MGLRRIVRRADRWDYLMVVVVLAAVGAYLRFVSAHRPPPEGDKPLETRSSEGMDKLWLESALGKDDVRPLPDPDMLWREPEPETVRSAAAEPPSPPEAAETARTFPAPDYAPEAAEPAPRPRIAPMAESLLKDRSASATSSAFIEFPKPVKAEPAPAATAAPAPAPAAAPRPKRTFRPLAGN
ncbi:MAG: hypothetical protein HY928_01620 [Elusimicrobia bacterium]|nr:hypothetical protein [Elusimicrobiota bacterium]